MEIKAKTAVISKICSVLRELASSKTDFGSFIRIFCNEEVLSFSATDGEVFATIELPLQDFLSIDVVEGGLVFVSSEHFLKTINSLKPANKEGFGCDFIHMLSDERGFHLSYEVSHRNGAVIKSNRTLPVTQEEKYSSISFQESDDMIVISSHILARCLSKVLYAAGIEDIDMQLNRVFVEVSQPNKI